MSILTQAQVQRTSASDRKPPRAGVSTYIGVAIVGLILLGIVRDVFVNPNFGWPVVGQYFLSKFLLKGLGLTVALTVIVMVLGVIGGLIVAMMRISNSRFLSAVAQGFINFFRGIPLLIQVIFWFNIAALFPALRVGIPFGPTLTEFDTNALVTPFAAAVIALTLNEAAYMAEIIRGGLIGVDRGQYEAAEALGMKPMVMLQVILPQAIRIIIPPTTNQLVTTFKNTALVSVIGLADLLHSAQIVYAANYQTIPLLISASIWYLLITSLLSWVQSRLERRYSRGHMPRTHRQRHELDVEEQAPEESSVPYEQR